MSHRYLLDTNILAELARNPAGAAARRIAAVGESAICTSAIVACEVHYGLAKRSSPQLTERMSEVLEAVEILVRSAGGHRNSLWKHTNPSRVGGRDDRAQRPSDRGACASCRPHRRDRQRSRIPSSAGPAGRELVGGMKRFSITFRTPKRVRRRLAAHIPAATWLLLALIAELDRREIRAAQGALSCAHWLSWACGIDTHTAREKVRVTRALTELPHTVTLNCNRVTVHQPVILFTTMTGPQPSARATADPSHGAACARAARTHRGATATMPTCRSVIAENARKRGQAWSVCTPCAQRSRTRSAGSRSHRHSSGDAWCAGQTSPTCEQAPGTCGDACRNVLSRLLRRWRRPVP